tara:strand:- start:24374 stop:24886 length:513 start_codon:yes stop_codon:yes gene_type:complete
MALWGNKDDKASTGTVTIAANGLVTGSSTKFETEARVGDYIVSNDDNFLITSITSNTVAQVIAGSAGGTIAAVGATNAYALSEKPKSLTVSEVHKGNISGNPEAVFGVDTDEVGVQQGAGHTGWVRRMPGSGGRAGRVQFEVLVAGGISGDIGEQSGDGSLGDDTEFADS